MKLVKFFKESAMKKLFCLLLIVIMICGFSTSCKNEGDSGKVSLIVSEMYGSLKPFDIYEIKDGYMQSLDNSVNRLSLVKGYNYCINQYLSVKMNEIDGELNLLSIDREKFKLTKWKAKNKNDIIYYSEYWGLKTRVKLGARVSFYKTIHINLEEKEDTFRITYYDLSSYYYDKPTGFNEIELLEKFKRVIEVPKSDIIKIEYII